jgi:hypothetical protein
VLEASISLTRRRENNSQDREDEHHNHRAFDHNETTLSICASLDEHANEQEQEE